MVDLTAGLTTLLQNLERVLPRRKVQQWEQGLYLWDGRIQKVKAKRFYTEEEVEDILTRERRKRATARKAAEPKHDPSSPRGALEEVLSRAEENVPLPDPEDLLDSRELERELGIKRTWIRGEPYETIVTEDLPPGAYWFWPIKGEIVTDEVHSKIKTTPRQDVMTGDGKLVNIGGTLTYRIASVSQYYRTLREDDEEITDLAAKAIKAAVESRGYEELREACKRKEREQWSKFDKEVLDRVRDEAKKYGIEVSSFGLTQFAHPETTYRLIGNHEWDAVSE